MLAGHEHGRGRMPLGWLHMHAITMSASGLSRRSMWRMCAWQWLLMLKGHAQPTAHLHLQACPLGRPPLETNRGKMRLAPGGGLRLRSASQPPDS